MNKEEIYIEPPKTNYIVLTTHLDNLELARYIEKIPNTYFATFSYVECYKQLQQENKQLKSILIELEEFLKENIELKPLQTTYFFKCNGKQKSISEIELEELKRVDNKIQELKEKYK